MNERIKELKEQALEYAIAVHEGHIVPPLDKEVWPIGNVFDEKFAELIVQECIDKIEEVKQLKVGHASPEYNQGFDDGMFVAIRTIEEHFGVEE